MSQIQHLDSASRRFSFNRLIPRRISGWADIGARPNLERSNLSLKAETGEGSEVPRAQNLGRSLHRLYPESERPLIFCTLAPYSAHPSPGPVFLLPPLPQHFPKSSQAETPCPSLPGDSPGSLGVHLAKGPRWCHRPPAASLRQGSRPPGPSRPPTGFPIPGPAPAAPPPDTPPSPPQTRYSLGALSPRRPFSPNPRDWEWAPQYPRPGRQGAPLFPPNSLTPSPLPLSAGGGEVRRPGPTARPGLVYSLTLHPEPQGPAARTPARRGPAPRAVAPPPRLHRRVRTAPTALQVGPPGLPSSQVCQFGANILN